MRVALPLLALLGQLSSSTGLRDRDWLETLAALAGQQSIGTVRLSCLKLSRHEH